MGLIRDSKETQKSFKIASKLPHKRHSLFLSKTSINCLEKSNQQLPHTHSVGLFVQETSNIVNPQLSVSERRALNHFD